MIGTRGVNLSLNGVNLGAESTAIRRSKLQFCNVAVQRVQHVREPNLRSGPPVSRLRVRCYLIL
jgi:hypothetical protein